MARSGGKGGGRRGGNRGHIARGRKDAYDHLKKRYGKHMAAAIANKGRTKAGRSEMARKAAATRRARGRRR